MKDHKDQLELSDDERFDTLSDEELVEVHGGGGSLELTHLVSLDIG